MSIISYAKSFWKSKDNQTGVLAFVGAAVSVGLHYLSLNPQLSGLVGVATFALAKINLPDNSVVYEDLDHAVQDGIVAYHGKNADGFVQLAADAVKAAQDSEAAAKVVAVPIVTLNPSVKG